ncbi:hypothetical protein EBM89_10400 [Cellulomonas triticagri]|uniref:Uncharacterized protein n=1 Tax=Cellulomonas triticagri TaxID=2483352 RepID=A0A3M2J905_9CELL|nr:hypothetical protein EBM89_10400 [Cellulomonas triticagri]
MSAAHQDAGSGGPRPAACTDVGEVLRRVVRDLDTVQVAAQAAHGGNRDVAEREVLAQVVTACTTAWVHAGHAAALLDAHAPERT